MNPYHLQNLQGLYVPRFFGYYEGATVFYGRDLTVGCMILEDCGRAVTLAERAIDSIKCCLIIHLVALSLTLGSALLVLGVRSFTPCWSCTTKAICCTATSSSTSETHPHQRERQGNSHNRF